MGFQEFLKKWPVFFSFVSFSLGAFGVLFFLKKLSVFDFFPFMASYGWWLTPGFFGIIAYYKFFQTDTDRRDADDCLDSCVYVVTSPDRLYNEMFRDNDSVVKGAQKFIHTVGSRSRDLPYLAELSSRLEHQPKIAHVRLLIGPPQHPHLEDHIKKLVEIESNRRRSNGDATIRVCEHPINGELPERFIVVSENKAVITLPSLDSAHGYDTALVIEDPTAAQKLGGIIRTLAQNCENVYIGSKRND